MSNLVYTADVAHCEGCSCELRGRCFRYWLHVNRKRQPSEIYARGIVYILEDYSAPRRECRHFRLN